jgi:hypothetical protein|tara:strand:+ start:438 stop:599 length:162 start_codon:yes stop_codon:yes gene_type:complete
MSIIYRWLCKIKGHQDNPPIIETWASRQGMKRTFYLCRRCKASIGEKYYESTY